MSEAGIKIRSHTSVFSQFAIKYEEQLNLAKAEGKGSTVGERVKNSKLNLTDKERSDMKERWIPYPEWAEYKVGIKSGNMTVLEPIYVPGLNK